jgi:5-methylcytosine-specific restriction endonuclease McrA
METIKFQLSRNTREVHKIFSDPSTPSYASAILLKDYYRHLDDPEEYQTDWRYYFIVRRLWLRKNRIEVNGDKFWVCHYCGKHIHKMPERNKKTQNLHPCVTVDHKIPRSEGIDILDTSNYLVSCYDCNCKKKSIPYDLFMKGMTWVEFSGKKEKKKKERPSDPNWFQLKSRKVA